MTSKIRSSPTEVFLGKGVLKICGKFTGVDKQNHISAWVFSSKFAACLQNTFF